MRLVLRFVVFGSYMRRGNASLGSSTGGSVRGGSTQVEVYLKRFFLFFFRQKDNKATTLYENKVGLGATIQMMFHNRAKDS